MDFSSKENYQQLAEYLRNQRLSQQLELDDVSEKIGVPIQHLKNIERGNFDRFDTFYLKMYLKKYVNYLSLNIDELYQQFYGNQIQKEVEVKIHKQKVQKRNRNLGRLAGVLCASLVIGLGIFYVGDMIKNANPKKEENNIVINNPNSSTIVGESQEKPQESIEENVPAPEQAPVEQKPQESIEENVPAPEQALVEQKPQEPITTVSKVSQEDRKVTFDLVTAQTEATLKLDFTGPCWLSLALGNESLIAGETYQAGGVFEKAISMEQFGTLDFNVGDANAVQISINNQVIEFEPSTPHQYIEINIKSE